MFKRSFARAVGTAFVTLIFGLPHVVTAQNPSTSGLTRLVRRLGSKPMTYVRHRCDAKVLHEGRNTRYAGCILTIGDEKGDTVTKRYFGSILERDGKFKFMSYTNQF